jgi:hypothetical protein
VDPLHRATPERGGGRCTVQQRPREVAGARCNRPPGQAALHRAATRQGLALHEPVDGTAPGQATCWGKPLHGAAPARGAGRCTVQHQGRSARQDFTERRSSGRPMPQVAIIDQEALDPGEGRRVAGPGCARSRQMAESSQAGSGHGPSRHERPLGRNPPLPEPGIVVGPDRAEHAIRFGRETWEAGQTVRGRHPRRRGRGAEGTRESQESPDNFSPADRGHGL